MGSEDRCLKCGASRASTLTSTIGCMHVFARSITPYISARDSTQPIEPDEQRAGGVTGALEILIGCGVEVPSCVLTEGKCCGAILDMDSDAECGHGYASDAVCADCGNEPSLDASKHADDCRKRGAIATVTTALTTLRTALAAAERERDEAWRDRDAWANAMWARQEERDAATARAEKAEAALRGHEALLNTLRIGVNAARGTIYEDTAIATMLRTTLQSLKGGSEP